MKRLRHPVRALREPFGTAGLIIALVALVAALGGTAFAASKLNSTQKKEVTKIAQTEAKKYAGKDGAPGATGPAGPAGAAGANGKDGSNGTNGTPGESVSVTAYVGEECEEGLGEGGVELANHTGTAYACNGKEGSPWTGGGTLPQGATETGTFAIRKVVSLGDPTSGTPAVTGINFSIPLAAPLDEQHVHIVTPAGEEFTAGSFTAPTTCMGSVAAPTAPSGNLCVYVEVLQNAFKFGAKELPPLPELLSATTAGEQFGAETSGAAIWLLPASLEGADNVHTALATGDYAVTG